MAFWHEKSLTQMSDEEWESLCDGCAKCCLHKLEDEKTGFIHYTNVACRLLELKTCRCKDYAGRLQKVVDCLDIRRMEPEQMQWLPSTCAYRLLSEQKELPSWHPLVSGRTQSVKDAGVSVGFFAMAEADVKDIRDHVIQWLDSSA